VVDHHEWSTTRSTGTSGSIVFGSRPRSRATLRIAARSRAADAGEVLQHDARDDERDLVDPRGVRRPARELAHVLSVTFLPSQLRSTLSSTSRMETGRREISDARRLERGERVERAGAPDASV